MIWVHITIIFVRKFNKFEQWMRRLFQVVIGFMGQGHPHRRPNVLILSVNAKFNTGMRLIAQQTVEK